MNAVFRDMKRLLFSFCAIALTASVAAGVAQAQTKPQRHLVYDFTVGVNSDSHDTNMSSRMDSNGSPLTGTGDTHYAGNATDKGQIALDVMGVEGDGGLIATVSETARVNRSAAPVTCVVYPNTNIICAQGQVNPEEMSVLRSLNPKFYDASSVDSKGQWHVGDSSGPVSITFSAAKGTGSMLEITADRLEQGGPPTYKSNSNAKYAYDTAAAVAKSLTEYQTIRQQQGAGQYANITVEVTAQLATDTKN